MNEPTAKTRAVMHRELKRLVTRVVQAKQIGELILALTNLRTESIYWFDRYRNFKGPLPVSRSGSYGKIKKLILEHGKKHQSFSVDDLMKNRTLKKLTTRKALSGNLYRLEKDGFLHYVDRGVEGRNGTPPRFSCCR